MAVSSSYMTIENEMSFPYNIDFSIKKGPLRIKNEHIYNRLNINTWLRSDPNVIVLTSRIIFQYSGLKVPSTGNKSQKIRFGLISLVLFKT